MQRRRPIDATFWFWAGVLFITGLFYVEIFPVLGGVLLVVTFVCFLWQFRKWHNDGFVTRQAIAWCYKYYGTCENQPVVDFMVAFGHDTECRFDELEPSVVLGELSAIVSDGEQFSCVGQLQDWLGDVLHDARIRDVDASQFVGITLHDAVQFATKCQQSSVE